MVDYIICCYMFLLKQKQSAKLTSPFWLILLFPMFECWAEYPYQREILLFHYGSLAKSVVQYCFDTCSLGPLNSVCLQVVWHGRKTNMMRCFCSLYKLIRFTDVECLSYLPLFCFVSFQEKAMFANEKEYKYL